MLSQQYYVVRSQVSGDYLVARPSADASRAFLLLFTSDHEALSYINAHNSGQSSHCRVESIATTSLKATLGRWQLVGVGIVEDPLVPQIQFFQVETGSPLG